MGIGDEIRAKRLGVQLSAQQIFTDRDVERARFDAKLDQVRAQGEGDPDWATDVRSPRENVLVFYGHGGMGKTRLSQELQRYFEDTAPPGVRRVAIRVDFAEPSSRDAELYLLTMRAGLAELTDTFPAFDTALTVYWSRQHPGASMAEFVRHQSVLGGLADRDRLAEHVRAFTLGLMDAAGGPAAEAVRRLATVTWDKISNARTVRRLLQDCPFFRSCVEGSDLDELRLHLPLLLAWDLTQMARRDGIELAVFLDTFERVTHGRAEARKGGLEDAVGHSAYFLHGATFVVTTRASLTWGRADRATALAYAGPTAWPGLAGPDECDQHEIGVLTTAVCERHLADCLVDETGQPAIPPPLRASIARLSGGVPLYLDVAVNHYLDLLATGRQPSADDFTAGLPEIVMRLMEDLDEEETDLLRVAALLGVFDYATLKAALPDVRSSKVRDFLTRSFVLDRGDDLYSVHELLQTSVRAQDEATSNPWSPEEWQQAEERVVSHWSTQFESRHAELWRDRRTQALAFWQLCGLYATTEADAEMLADVIMLVQLHGVWATLDAGRDQPAELVNERGAALLQLLDGVLGRQIGRLADVESTLADVADSPALSPQLVRLARYYLGETRDVHAGSAVPIFAELAGVDDRLGTEARLAHAHSLTRVGDLAGALAIAETFPAEQDDPEFRYRLHELLGVIWLFAGGFRRAADHFEVSRAVGVAEGSALLEALGLRHLALTLCWTSPEEALTYLDDAERLNRDLALPPGIGQCLLARAVTAIGSAPREEIDSLLAAADDAFTRAGYLDDALGPHAGRVLAAAASGEEALAHQRLQALIRISQGRRPRTWLAMADIWAGDEGCFEQVSWPQGQEEARRAWAGVLGGKLDRARAFHLDPPR